MFASGRKVSPPRLTKPQPIEVAHASRPTSPEPAHPKSRQLRKSGEPVADPALELSPKPFAPGAARRTKSQATSEFARRTLALSSDAVVLTLASPFIASWFAYKFVRRWFGRADQ